MTRMLFGIVVLSVTPLLAADLTGTWTGKMTPDEGSSKDNSAYLVLKAEGARVTGTAGPDENRQSVTIQNGRLDGNKFTFRTVGPHGGVFDFELILDGDSLRGAVNMTRGDDKQRGKAEFRRVN